jgi:NAD(P)H-hydrate epimerase
MISYLTGKEASEIDAYTINVTGIPGITLMEKAASCVADFIAELSEGKTYPLKALFVCENGNNGGDGVAAARILKERGFEVAVYLINAVPKKTDSFITQCEKAVECGVPVFGEADDNGNYNKADELSCLSDLLKDYDVLVDAVFGVGLSRDVANVHADIIE